MRTIKNGELRLTHLNDEVTLVGWVAKARNKKMIFVDLRDISGIVQLVIMPENSCYEVANSLKNEDVIKVKGKVVQRSAKNKDIPTGDVEIEVINIEVLSKSINPPIIIADKTDALEETRLKYRYLDLRRPILANNFVTRSKVSSVVRNYLESLEFLEIETPVLTKATPEGARDYVVPSRVHEGKYYALPQSPQMFKQLLMVSGFEKYYQIVKCFRDEDLRKDRQPEFTQIDIEASFVAKEDVMDIGENLMKKIFKEIKNIEFKEKFQRMTYADAMNFYGSDKPDLRFDLQLENLTNIFENTEFEFFKNIILAKKEIRGIRVFGNFSRKEIDKLTETAKKHHASGLAFLKKENDEYSGSLAKISDEEKKAFNLENGQIMFVVADKVEIALNALGQVRLELGRKLELITDGYKFVWITDWPLYEFDEEDNRLYAAHHPFTLPSEIEKFNNKDASTLAEAYDLVLNGYEIGGGSLRISDQNMQAKMFENLGFSEEEALKQFGFFIEALKYGTPPHGGIAFGLDRICMILCNTENIRDVIAFPKTQSASCLMSEAPGEISQETKKELSIK